MNLTIENLHKNYIQPHANLHILRGLNLTTKQGESVAILGQSGSGKSTLLSLLAGLDSPTQGEIRFGDRSLSSFSESDLAKFRAQHLGIIFQQFHLMSNLTALENVSLPLEIVRAPDALARATLALKQVGLEHRTSHFPSKLSGGECQRVAVARAFVMEPELLLADEPSGNLDNQTGKAIMDLVFSLTELKGTTLILVTHNLELADRCRKIYELKDGLLTPVNH